MPFTSWRQPLEIHVHRFLMSRIRMKGISLQRRQIHRMQTLFFSFHSLRLSKGGKKAKRTTLWARTAPIHYYRWYMTDRITRLLNFALIAVWFMHFISWKCGFDIVIVSPVYIRSIKRSFLQFSMEKWGRNFSALFAFEQIFVHSLRLFLRVRISLISVIMLNFN